MADLVKKSDLAIAIDGEEYQLDQIPSESSGVVLNAKKKLSGSINLAKLVEDLGLAGELVRIAYNGVGAAGPKFQQLQIEIQGFGYNVAKLCNQSALTISRFESASATVVDTLQVTYSFLLDGLEEIAVSTLAGVSKLAGDMAKAAEDLHKNFAKEADNAEILLGKAQRQKGDEALHLEVLKAQRIEAEHKRKLQESLLDDAKQLQDQAEAERRKMEMKEYEELTQDNTFINLINGLTSLVGLGKVLDTGADRAKGYAQLIKDALEKEEKYRQMRYKAMNDMVEFANFVLKCDNDTNVAQIAVDALHRTAGALKDLSVLMLQACEFWKMLQDHCNSLSGSQMKNLFDVAMKLPQEKRAKVWTSAEFKKSAVRFYAGWVALHCVCFEYIEPIKARQQELYAYLKENPTYEQSRRNLPELAAMFLKVLEERKEEISVGCTDTVAN